MVEQSAHNRLVVGSIPTGPTKPSMSAPRILCFSAVSSVSRQLLADPLERSIKMELVIRYITEALPISGSNGFHGSLGPRIDPHGRRFGGPNGGIPNRGLGGDQESGFRWAKHDGRAIASVRQGAVAPLRDFDISREGVTASAERRKANYGEPAS